MRRGQSKFAEKPEGSPGVTAVSTLNIAVTGGSGKVGREAVKALRRAGHRVANFDLRASPDGIRTPLADFADYGQAIGALAGVDTIGKSFDAVVHLAGIPAPGLAPDHRIFENNTLSTYNVFHACMRLGIRRIVWASSETLLGLPFDTPPPFAPLDESVSRPEWSYALSKQLGEVMAEAFVRWVPDASISSLRFSNVFTPEDYAQIPEIQTQVARRKANLWSYVDARDCGEACRLAVETGAPGHEAYIIAAADTLMETPSAELMRRFFPDTPLAANMDAFQSLLSSEKAAQRLGFRPQHSWRATPQP